MKQKWLRAVAVCLLATCLMSLAVSGEVAQESSGSAVGTDFQADGRIPSAEFVPVLSAGAYTLSYRDSTAEIEVRSNATGVTWYSNPQDMDSYPDISPDERNSLISQLLVTYADGQEIKTMTSYGDSVSLVQHKAYIKDDALWVEYQFGKQAYTNDLLPAVISQTRMEKDIFSKLTQEERAQILTRYDLFDIDKMDPMTAKTVLITYPILKKHSIYVRQQFPDYMGESVYALFKKAGYTTESLARDCRENGVKDTYVKPVTFHFRMEYRLTADGFSATLDNAQTRYDADHPPLIVQLLPCFGCANSRDTGYMFVPDGSGATISLNNGKTQADSYWEPLFGQDKALGGTETEANHEVSLLPVFALSSKRWSFLANIDEGYECAGISANVAGQKGTYNEIGAYFSLFPYGTVSLNGSYLTDTAFVKTAPRLFSGNLSVSYHLMAADASVGEMANFYRSILKSNGTLPRERKSSTAATLELIGTAGVRAKFLGIPYTKLAALTTYNQAAALVRVLGAGRVTIKYTSAANGGLGQKRADRLKLEHVLGNVSGLEALRSLADVFVSLNAQQVSGARKSDTARFLSKEPAKVYQYDPVSRCYNQDGADALLSASKLEGLAAGLAKSAAASGAGGVNLTDVGYQLNSDFNEAAPYDRRQTRIAVQSYLKTLSRSVPVSAEYGSYFSLPYLSMVWDIPTDDSGYTIEDEAVPFYAMVLRGAVPYSVAPINESADARAAFLQAVSIGARLQFSWVYHNAQDVVDAREIYFDRYYGSTLSEARGDTRQMAQVFEKLGDSAFVGYRTVAPGLTESSFSNGVKIYVNYGGTARTADGHSVPASDYLCVGP